MERANGLYLAITVIGLALAVYFALAILGLLFKLVFLVAAAVLAVAAYRTWTAQE
jgi:hypothetical protein